MKNIAIRLSGWIVFAALLAGCWKGCVWMETKAGATMHKVTAKLEVTFTDGTKRVINYSSGRSWGNNEGIRSELDGGCLSIRHRYSTIENLGQGYTITRTGLCGVREVRIIDEKEHYLGTLTFIE